MTKLVASQSKAQLTGIEDASLSSGAVTSVTLCGGVAADFSGSNVESRKIALRTYVQLTFLLLQSTVRKNMFILCNI